MKKIFMNNCTGCHSTSYTLQFPLRRGRLEQDHRPHEDRSGHRHLSGANAKPNQILQKHQKQLAAYLARARGPGDSSMKVAPRPRPSGEAARAVVDALRRAAQPDAGIGSRYNANDGTDWRWARRPSSASCRTTGRSGSTARSTSPATTPTAA